MEKATLTFGVPFWRSNTIDLFVPGRDSLTGLGSFYQNLVAEDYFDATGTTIRRGRPLILSDRSGPPRVAVVSETLAEKVWPGADPIGQCVKVHADTMPCVSVVGVARDVRWGSLGDEDRMQIYQPMNLEDSGWLFIRTAGDPARMTEPLRRELQRLMPGAAYVNVRGVGATLDFVLRPWRLGATMFTLFGGLGESTTGGPQMNIVTKTGGNTFAGGFFISGTGDKFQGPEAPISICSRPLTGFGSKGASRRWK